MLTLPSTVGSDSSATALRMTLFYICASPVIYTRVVSELTTALREHRITRPIIRSSESLALPYLQSCIREGLRLYPPVVGQLAKEVPPSGDKIDGKFAPGGTIIGWNSWGLMRDKETFGADAGMFRPERWLPEGGAGDAKRKMMEEVQGLIFGYGRFGCLGKNVAVMELNKYVPEVSLIVAFSRT